MIYKLAYAVFAIMYIIGVLFDSNFKKCWVRHIALLIICFVLFMQIAGVA